MAAARIEFALTVLDVQKISPHGSDIQNGDRVVFDTSTKIAKSHEYFGLCDLHEPSKHCWTGTAFDGEHFAAKIKERRPTTKHVIFYIHGFNNQPFDALNTYAELYKGIGSSDVLLIPVVWACSDWILTGTRYLADKYIAKLTGKGLGRAFFDYFLKRDDSFRVHFLAHSMGNRVLDHAITEFAHRLEAKKLKPIVDTIWSVASDVPNDIFTPSHSGRIWHEIASQVYVYYAPTDHVLQFSWLANLVAEFEFSGRLGITGPSPNSFPQNVHPEPVSFNKDTDVLGHRYQAHPELLKRIRARL